MVIIDLGAAGALHLLNLDQGVVMTNLISTACQEVIPLTDGHSPCWTGDELKALWTGGRYAGHRVAVTDMSDQLIGHPVFTVVFHHPSHRHGFLLGAPYAVVRNRASVQGSRMWLDQTDRVRALPFLEPDQPYDAIILSSVDRAVFDPEAERIHSSPPASIRAQGNRLAEEIAKLILDRIRRHALPA